MTIDMTLLWLCLLVRLSIGKEKYELILVFKREFEIAFLLSGPFGLDIKTSAHDSFLREKAISTLLCCRHLLKSLFKAASRI